MDYTSWDKFDDFLASEAAYLWYGESPSLGTRNMSGLVAARFHLLTMAVANSQLVMVVTRSRPLYNPDPRITRLSLKGWAKRRGETPPFLFLSITHILIEGAAAPIWWNRYRRWRSRR